MGKNRKSFHSQNGGHPKNARQFDVVGSIRFILLLLSFACATTAIAFDFNFASTKKMPADERMLHNRNKFSAECVRQCMCGMLSSTTLQLIRFLWLRPIPQSFREYFTLFLLALTSSHSLHCTARVKSVDAGNCVIVECRVRTQRTHAFELVRFVFGGMR